jgi:hypothetical protein
MMRTQSQELSKLSQEINISSKTKKDKRKERFGNILRTKENKK